MREKIITQFAKGISPYQISNIEIPPDLMKLNLQKNLSRQLLPKEIK